MSGEIRSQSSSPIIGFVGHKARDFIGNFSVDLMARSSHTQFHGLMGSRLKDPAQRPKELKLTSGKRIIPNLPSHHHSWSSMFSNLTATFSRSSIGSGHADLSGSSIFTLDTFINTSSSHGQLVGRVSESLAMSWPSHDQLVVKLSFAWALGGQVMAERHSDSPSQVK